MTALTKHYSNPAALAFECELDGGGCGALPGANCFGDQRDVEGRYQHWMHAARTRLATMPDTREEWEDRARQIRVNVR